MQQVAQSGLSTTERASCHRNATPEKDNCRSKRHKELVAYLEQHGLLPSLQSAYRKHHSTETAVLKVVSYVPLAADRGDVTLLSLPDLSEAFDTVDHKILINRLQTSFGVRGKVLSWILSFITQRTQIVSFNAKQSTKSAVVCGVPQGIVLGPVLFLLYTADVIEISRRRGITPHSYSDDTQLSIHTPASSCVTQIPRMTACIEELERWMSSKPIEAQHKQNAVHVVGQQTASYECTDAMSDPDPR